METDALAVAHLHAVTLQVQAGRSADRMDILPEPIGFEFILGLGADGLTPFEAVLLGKRPGQSLYMAISRTEWCRMVGHLTPPPDAIPPGTETLHLRIHVEATHPAPQREVIKGLAEVTNKGSCGGGCDCGCGCG